MLISVDVMTLEEREIEYIYCEDFISKKIVNDTGKEKLLINI